jgi:hypothetical protein
MHAATSKVENSAQGLSCQLNFVHALIYDFFKDTASSVVDHCIGWQNGKLTK